ncbi:CBS domain-containing protein [Streptomyces sp. NPDC002573]|uniref:CBS domain-containing protein n=1 Tax=Streptomyces sp. NPDC002573 TaxID=3364651 RepID=UPI0036C16F26
MKRNKAGSAMTSDVIRAECFAPFKEVARLLADGWIRGLPVVDEDDKVIVVEGVGVPLIGQLERRSRTEIVLSMTKQIDGVVAVANQLTCRFYDSRLPP